ncbi:MAG: hypothetical protein RL701_886 [Pseudomonadota bacterium]|jgi:hypothetical protein
MPEAASGLAEASDFPCASAAAAKAFVDEVRAGFEARTLAPYLGPGVAAWKPSVVPCSPEVLADFLGKKAALPKRVRGNMWAAAQYIEGARHRATLKLWIEEAFKTPLEPNALHKRLASYELPLIVDTWYDSAMRSALAGKRDWIEMQGISRAPIGEDRWTKAYGANGAEVPLGEADAVKTLLYKPIGAIAPASNFIISDSDYVEVLTEIDIQSPIPDTIRNRRSSLGFVFLGCRFNEQTLRTYARQVTKRSRGANYYVVDPGSPPTKPEQRFFRELGMKVLSYPWPDVFEMLSV